MRTAYIIAGHAGSMTGAAKYIDEGKETILLADLIAQELTRLKVPVKRDPPAQALPAVIAWLRKISGKKDILLDIHFNASTNISANGTLVVLPDTATTTECEMGHELAAITADCLNIQNRNLLYERDTPRKRIGILRDVDCINLLLEVCFVTNPRDADQYHMLREVLAVKIAHFIYQKLQTI